MTGPIPRGAVPLALCAMLSIACATDPSGGDSTDERDATAPRRKIVVMAPAAAEMLDALGAGDQVVGIGDFVSRPGSIAALPKVGAYDRPNVETVLELEADLLITTASRAAVPTHERLESLGVEVLALDTSTYEGVFRSLADVGRAIGREEEAAGLDRHIRDALSETRERSSGLPERRVLFVVGRDPLYVAGPGSHIDEMIAASGGVNVAGDARSPYERLSMEAVLESAPDVIIDMSDNGLGAPRGRDTSGWERWEFLPAVRDNRVYRVDPSRLSIPGIRLPEMTELMGRLIHPEVFGEPDDDDFGPLPEQGAWLLLVLPVARRGGNGREKQGARDALA